MLELKQFDCKCKKCFCLNSVYSPGKICADCFYGLHEGVKN
jgi:hypothetical protein